MARPLIEESSGNPSVQARTELTERRYIYNGDLPAAQGEPREFSPRGNRPVRRRKQSAFNIIAAVFVVSLLIVFYVWNKITVNQLVIDVSELQSQYQKAVSTNEILRADINRKSSLERISLLASQLGLTVPKEQPVWFSVDDGRVDPQDRR